MRKEKLEELKRYVLELKTIDMKKRNVPSRFINSEVYDVILENGNVIRREKLIKGNNNGSAVIIMPITKDNQILTVIEPRVFTNMTVGVGFPAGYIEKGETSEEAAIRELKEETGYVGSKLILLDTFYQDEGISSALNRSYIILDAERKYNQTLDDSEYIKYMLFTYDELLELEKIGYISGANTKLTLCRYKDWRRK